MDKTGATAYLVLAGTPADFVVWCKLGGLDPRQPWVTYAEKPSDFTGADPRNTVITLGPGYEDSPLFGSTFHQALQWRISRSMGKPKEGWPRLLEQIGNWTLALCLGSALVCVAGMILAYAFGWITLGAIATGAGFLTSVLLVTGAGLDHLVDHLMEARAVLDKEG